MLAGLSGLTLWSASSLSGVLWGRLPLVCSLKRESNLRHPCWVADGEILDAGGKKGMMTSHFWPCWQATGSNYNPPGNSNMEKQGTGNDGNTTYERHLWADIGRSQGRGNIIRGWRQANRGKPF